jgi:hypothetical protein
VFKVLKHTLSGCAFALLFFGVAMLFSCASAYNASIYNPDSKPEYKYDNRSVSRADPGYLQYLEKFSMRRKAMDLSAVISGSALGWQRSGSTSRADELLRSAAVWLYLNPQTIQIQDKRSVLSQLSRVAIWNSIKRMGISGLYLAPTGGSGSLWEQGSIERQSWSGDYEDVAQYDFAQYVGNDDEYKLLVKNSNNAESFMGGDIIPATTGLGPDFFLAARNFRDYTGIYCLVEVPKESWALLPSVAPESPGAALIASPKISPAAWLVSPLSAAQVTALSAKDIIPAALRQETLGYLPPSGWAATGEVRGVDGVLRRWVYRYFGDYKRAVLNWADPSATARQILNGSVIRQVGLFGNVLSGYSVNAFIGLESDRKFSAEIPGESAARPHVMALEASGNLSRQIRSYGGWSFLRDALPLAVLPDFLENGPDFALDGIGSPLAEQSLLTGDVRPLRLMLDEALQAGLDFKRLAHKGAYPYTTPAGFVAQALGLTAEKTISLEQRAEIIRGHKLLIFFQAMQPGLLVLTGQDLVGAMPISWRNMSDAPDKWDKRLASLGAYSLFRDAPDIGDARSIRPMSVNTQGLPQAASLYGPLDEQFDNPESFLSELVKMLGLRKHFSLAQSKLAGRFKARSRVVVSLLLQRADDKGYVICLSNFSRAPADEHLTPQQFPALAQALRQGQATVVYGNVNIQTFDENSLDFTIPGWEGVLIVIEKTGNVAQPDQKKLSSLLPPEPETSPEISPDREGDVMHSQEIPFPFF